MQAQHVSVKEDWLTEQVTVGGSGIHIDLIDQPCNLLSQTERDRQAISLCKSWHALH